MNLQYVLWFLGSLIISLGLFALMNRGRKALPQCLLMGAIGTVFGAVLAKLVYCLAMLNFTLMQGWLAALTDVTAGTFSYYGGMAGFCLGGVLTARLTHEKPMALLDAFAPAGVLLAALARFGEFFLQGVGTRDFLYWELPEHCFFPLAVSNEYGEWLYAVFMLEGLLTLCVFALCIACFKQHRFLRALFYLCLLQILCESLRTDSFTWLFVKVEQLICMLGLAGVLLVYCIKTPVRSSRRWLPILYCFLAAWLFVVLEFAFNGKIPMMPDLLSYGLLLAGLAALGVNEVWAFRRMEAKK